MGIFLLLNDMPTSLPRTVLEAWSTPVQGNGAEVALEFFARADDGDVDGRGAMLHGRSGRAPVPGRLTRVQSYAQAVPTACGCMVLGSPARQTDP